MPSPTLVHALDVATRTIRQLRAERDAATDAARAELERRLDNERALAQSLAERAKLELEVATARASAAASRSERHAAERELRQIRGELLRVTAELARRGDATPLPTAPASSPQSPQGSPQAEIGAPAGVDPEPEDSTAARFSLLEPYERDP